MDFYETRFLKGENMGQKSYLRENYLLLIFVIKFIVLSLLEYVCDGGTCFCGIEFYRGIGLRLFIDKKGFIKFLENKIPCNLIAYSVN